MGKLSALALSLACVSSVFAEDYQWTDMDTRKINKEDPRAFFILADSLEAAFEPVSIDGVDGIYSGANCRLLNGGWKFFFAKSPEEIKGEYVAENFDDSGWDLVEVPGTWHTQGYDRIWYPNVTHEFFFDREGRWLDEFKSADGGLPEVFKKPFINEIHREAGIYRTNFDLPKAWDGRDVILRFGGVKSGFKLYVNGKFAGYSEDSFMPAEIDVTKLLKPGRNSVAAVVYKFTTGSFFEIQDMPHTMGIFRDVVAMARPKTRLSDYYAVAEFSGGLKSAELKFDARIKNPAPGAKLDVFIADSGGKPLGGGAVISGAADSESFRASANVGGFELWSPDKPNLYKIVMRLSDASGAEIETVWADWAFRKFEIRGTGTFLNGKPFLFKGVDRHNWSPDKGSAVDFKWMKLDCELMKRANINSIRTSHYPNDEKFYMLASRYGLAIMDENNHETHGLRDRLPAEDDKFVAPSVERMENMVCRDRNVPCVIIWSLGNESGTYHTKSHKAMEAAARRLDPTRPIHSEPGAGQESNTSDFVSPMYGGMGRMQAYLNSKSGKPFIFCEYCFAVGNAIGNLKDIWDMVRREPSLRGGFIWDWVDRTLYIKDKDGKTILADGRSYGTPNHAGIWNSSGVVFADRALPPKYFEVRRVYQDIQIEPVDAANGVLKFANEFVDTNLNEFDLQVVVERNGLRIAEKTVRAPDLPAGEGREIKIGLPEFDMSGRGEYFYTVNVLRRGATPFADEKSELSSAQFFLGKSGGPSEIPARGTVSVSRKGGGASLSASGVKAVFDTQNPRLVSLEANGERLIASPVEFDISSAWMDNHGRFKKEAQNAGLDSLKLAASSFEIKKLSPSAVEAHCNSTFANEDGDGFEVNAVYTMLGSGALRAAVRVVKINDMPEGLMLPRVGVRMGLSRALSDVSYFGRGGMHNYCDKFQAAPVGLYNIDVDGELVRYVRPQDCGNREQVRWMKLADRSGGGLAFVAESPLPMSLLPYSQKVLADTLHPEYLPEPSENEFRIAWKVAGVGNGALGPNTLDMYRPIFKGGVDFSFTIMPLKNAKEYFDFGSLAFPKKFSFAFENPAENIRDENLKPMPEGRWVSRDAKASYSSRSQYSPHRETVLEAAGENYGFHTDRNDPRQWMVIDLGKPHDITGALIYNRKDAQGDRTDNMLMYVSDDGENWREVWKTREAKRSWTVKFDKPVNGRYVRLLLDKKEYFHLSGVKIFAR